MVMKKVVGIILAGLLYYAAAVVTDLFSIDPVNYLPVWPAAGIALFLLFIFGEIAVIGIFLGSLYAVIDFAIRHGDVHWFETPFLWLGMAAMNALQAWACYRLLSPYTRDQARLKKHLAIFRLIFQCRR